MKNVGGGVVAAGHPLSAEAGARVLREGGNAVDAAIAAVVMSFVAESPLTGLGAGGFMLVHVLGREPELLDFFVAAPAQVPVEAGLEAIDVSFGDAVQRFHCGAASIGAYGTPAGLQLASERFGTLPFAELVAPAVERAREGVPTTAMHEFLYLILEPILTRWPECRAIYAPDGSVPKEGETRKFTELADSLELFASEGARPFYEGAVAQRIVDRVGELGGVLTAEDLARYEVVTRRPGSVDYRGHRVLTNPPPASGGVLIAASLTALEMASQVDAKALAGAMAVANEARTADFSNALAAEDEFDRLLYVAAGEKKRLDELGSTTHISVLDGSGMAVSCTCSNGSGSGIYVPGTGIALNNMLGELDLQPLGLGSARGGTRITSMMAPTVVLDARGQPVLVLGSAGSNRIRSAILQVIVNYIDRGLTIKEAVNAPRMHFEEGTVQAEPGVDEQQLAEIERSGILITRWSGPNLFFGGCQAASRDKDGRLAGAGDPRRGGAVVVV